MKPSSVAALLILLGGAVPVASQEAPAAGDAPSRDLTALTLEELLEIEVTTVSRKGEKLAQTAAAVYVLRGEDLRRTGARSIPEALRYVPGLHVARIDANKWSVTARGFGGLFANKLQVLVDGRSVYSPLFSGVYWDTVDTYLDDVDRIEVIRGPGSAVWGANAVNGVINIITRPAEATPGGHVFAGGGTEHRAFGGARYGTEAGEDLWLRLFGKGESVDEGYRGRDDGRRGRGGFRLDWTPDQDRLTLQGEWADLDSRSRTTTPSTTAPFERTFVDTWEYAGGYVSARWERTLSDASSISAGLSHAYYRLTFDRLNETRNTTDVDVTHRFCPLDGHDVVWGLGWRRTADEIRPNELSSFDPDSRVLNAVSAFVQDRVALTERLSLIAGARFEYNPYTRLEAQPTLRAAWEVDDDHFLWAAASRALRTPSRSDRDVASLQSVLPTVPPTHVVVFGDDDYRSEKLLAFELGYRVQPHASLSADLALFHNRYEDLRSVDQEPPFVDPGPPLRAVVPLVLENEKDAQGYGAELSVVWQPWTEWTLSGGYAFMHLRIDATDDSTDPDRGDSEAAEPVHSGFLRSSLTLARDVDLDLMGRYVGGLRRKDVSDYATVEARLAWRPRPGIELSAVGQNLLRRRHPEAATTETGTEATEVERGIYLMLTWSF